MKALKNGALSSMIPSWINKHPKARVPLRKRRNKLATFGTSRLVATSCQNFLGQVAREKSLNAASQSKEGTSHPASCNHVLRVWAARCKRFLPGGRMPRSCRTAPAPCCRPRCTRPGKASAKREHVMIKIDYID